MTETAEATAAATAGGDVSGRRASLWGDAWLELRRRPLFWVAAALLAFMVLLALFPSLFTDVDPNKGCVLAHSKGGSSAGHPFGFDTQGCDLFSQVVHGARPTILIGLAVTVGSLIISIVFGTLAGFYGGLLDSVIARITDIFFGLPFVLGATVILVAFPDHGVGAMCLVLVVLGWTTMTRIMRSQVISVKSMDYVRAARALGAGDVRIMFRHILPNAIAPVFVYATLNVGVVIGSEATLDFLGVGLQYPTVSWGRQLSEAQEIFTDFPYLLVYPALFLTATVLSFLLLGDAVRDALDPKLR
jgi:oligopeptide transport system permease protein